MIRAQGARLHLVLFVVMLVAMTAIVPAGAQDEVGAPGPYEGEGLEGLTLECYLCHSVGVSSDLAVISWIEEDPDEDIDGYPTPAAVWFRSTTDAFDDTRIDVSHLDVYAADIQVTPDGLATMATNSNPLNGSAGNEDLLAIDRVTGTVRSIVPAEPGCAHGLHQNWASGPRRMSDDGLVAIATACNAGGVPWTTRVIDAHDGSVVASWEDTDICCAISPDGSTVVGHDVLRRLDSGEQINWDHGVDLWDGGFTVDHDASHIAMSGVLDGQRGIWTLEVGTSTVTAITTVDEFGPDLQVTGLSDDGSTVLFYEDFNGGGAQQAYLGTPDGPPRLVSTHDGGHPVPDGVHEPVVCDRTCARVLFGSGIGVHSVTVGSGGTATLDTDGLSDTTAFQRAATADDATALSVAMAVDTGWTAGQRVLIARNDGFADSLSSGALQAEGPLLLTPPDGLPDDLVAELTARPPSEAVLLGGRAAVSQAVESQLDDLGIPWRRRAGASRVDTAVQVAAELLEQPGAPRTVMLARAFPSDGAPESQAYVDTLASGALAADRGIPVLLTPGEALAPSVADLITTHEIQEVVIVGGTAAIGPTVEAALVDLGVSVRRLAGPNRYATATAVAAERGHVTADSADGVVLVDSDGAYGWVAGLVSAGRSARLDAPVVLATDRDVPPDSASWMRSSVDRNGGEVVVTCVVAATSCEAGRGLMGLPPKVDMAFDPPSGSVVAQGDTIAVAMDPVPTDATVTAFGSCTTHDGQPFVDGTVTIDVNESFDSCDLLIAIRWPQGTTQTLVASYGTVADAIVVESDRCEGLGGAVLSADGRWLAYTAGTGCLDRLEGVPTTAVFVDTATGERHRRPTSAPDGRLGDLGLSDDGRFLLVAGEVVDRVTGDRYDLARTVDPSGDDVGPQFGVGGPDQMFGDRSIVVAVRPEVEDDPSRSSYDAAVWDLEARRIVRRFDCVDVSGYCLSPNGRVTATGSAIYEDQQIYDTTTGTVDALYVDERDLPGLRLTNDLHTRVFSRVVELADGTGTYRGTYVQRGPDGPVVELDPEHTPGYISDDDRFLVTQNSDRIIELATGSVVAEPFGNARLSRDGSVMALLTAGTVRLVDGPGAS